MSATDKMVLVALNAEFREQYRSWGRVDPDTGEVKWEDRTRLDQFHPTVANKARAALTAVEGAYREQTARMEELADLWEGSVSSYDYEAAMRNAAKDLRDALNGEKR